MFAGPLHSDYWFLLEGVHFCSENERWASAFCRLYWSGIGSVAGEDPELQNTTPASYKIAVDIDQSNFSDERVVEVYGVFITFSESRFKQSQPCATKINGATCAIANTTTAGTIEEGNRVPMRSSTLMTL